jgi:hypothetical protein
MLLSMDLYGMKIDGLVHKKVEVEGGVRGAEK